MSGTSLFPADRRRLEGKLALVAGSSRGIGRAIAERLAQEGAYVIINARNQTKINQTVEEFRRKGYKCDGIAGHAGNAEDRKKVVQFAAEAGGGIDIFVYNVAVNPTLLGILKTSESEWDKIFDVNVKSAFIMTNLVVPEMEKKGGGSIIYVSSILLHAANLLPISGAYTVSKLALLGICRSVSCDVSDLNIRVNCILPGLVKTEFAKNLLETDTIKEIFYSVLPMHRLGEPEEVAGLVAFLSSSEASYITGQNLGVGGGFAKL